MRFLGFDWDATNTAKLASHGLAPDDIEYLFDEGAADTFRHPRDQRRWIALGFVPDGRFVLAVLELDEATRWIRVVTAYEPTSPKWWNIYAKAKGFPP